MEPKNEIVDPRKLNVGYLMEKPSVWARKQYFSVVGEVIREQPYDTAAKALAEAVRRWKEMCAEYDAKIDAAIAEWYELEKAQDDQKTSASPAGPEEAQVVTE